MEYLTQVIGVFITHITDAIKKEEILVQPQHNSSRLLIGQGTRQDRDGDYRSNVQLMSRLVFTAFEDEAVTLQNLRIYQ